MNTTMYRASSLTWAASTQIYWNYKRMRLYEKRSQLEEDCFGTLKWPPFHCFGTPIWSPWSHVKTLYSGISVLAFTLASRRRAILVLQLNSEMIQLKEKWIRKSCSFISLHSKYPQVSYGNIRGKHLLIDCFIHFATSQTSWTLTW